MAARKKFDKLQLNPAYTDETSERQPQTEVVDKKSTRKYAFRPSVTEYKKDKVYTVGFIPTFIPFLVVFILSVINRFLDISGAFDTLGNTAFLMIKCLIYLVIFIVPALVYCKIKKEPLHTSLSLHRFSLSYLPFIILGFVLLTLVIATEKLSIAHFFPQETMETTISLVGNKNPFGTILAYALFPAVCEELFLRGFLQNGISKTAGGFTGIVVSALAFALIHLDLRYFTVYLSSGLILAICAHVTNSVFPSIIIHVLNNIFSLYFSARLSFIAAERTGNIFIIIVLTFFVFLILLVYLKGLETICVKKAYIEDIKKKDPDNKVQKLNYRQPFRLSSSTGYTLHKFLRVVFSPALIVAEVIFLFVVIM